jgi:hypothetical protein
MAVEVDVVLELREDAQESTAQAARPSAGDEAPMEREEKLLKVRCRVARAPLTPDEST